MIIQWHLPVFQEVFIQWQLHSYCSVHCNTFFRLILVAGILLLLSNCQQILFQEFFHQPDVLFKFFSIYSKQIGHLFQANTDINQRCLKYLNHQSLFQLTQWHDIKNNDHFVNKHSTFNIYFICMYVNNDQNMLIIHKFRDFILRFAESY